MSWCEITLGSAIHVKHGFAFKGDLFTNKQELARPSAEGYSFAFETTLSGRTYASMIDTWRANGYTVKLIFLSLASAEEAVARVANRVRQGGHNIPTETIRRRFESGLIHFQDTYRQRVDF